ncbi:hypothetical protein CDD80_861 [Ophiocordyceps camponoti-rufipedis]|uniref:DUF1746 domain-containing protein n=1 Tax=Ophiocordyceps camponoti-rufipedis TaxID=2004952 RepID=A0A2C5ZBS7_9HYPO|nr:hypothetical protein CDD80_861 [Ophiocordyceps camponoti-rufipedis]
MSDDASPSRPVRNLDSPANVQAGDDDLPVADEMAEQRDAGSPSASRQPRRRRSRSAKKRHPGLAKKLSFLSHLLKSLDTIVIAEISCLYYMECSLWRFLLRCAGEFTYLSPKDESFPIFMPVTFVQIWYILVSNLICLFCHLVFSPPVGPEYHRGYQHGGLIIDFIGQKPPTYRLYYCLADLMILALQCLMLAAHNERELLRAALKTFRPMLPVADEPDIVSRQDMDAEERGVAREQPTIGSAQDPSGIELQPLSRPREETFEGGDDTAPLLPEVSDGSSPTVPLSDVMASGNAVIGHFHVVESLLSASTGFERTAAHSLQTISYGATMAALQARRQSASARGPSPHPNR